MAYDIGPKIGIDGEAEFRKAIQQAAQAVKTLGSEMKAVSSSFAGNERSIESYAAKNEVLRKSITAQEDKIQLLNQGLAAAAEKFGEADTRTLKWQQAVNEATAELNRMRSQLSQNEREMDELGDETEDLGDALDDAGDSALTFGDILKANIISDLVVDGIRKLADGLKQFASFSMESGMNFEAQMSRVQAISGATATETERLADKAKEMGETTVFSATESAQALEYMAMAGWKTEDMLSGIAGVMNLAAASGEELAATSDIVTDALTAFGTDIRGFTKNGISNVEHFADVLAAASTNANTNVSMMGESFKYAAPVAGALGYTAEDVALALGTMANSGVKATQAGTALRSIITNLSSPSDDLANAMDVLGLSLEDSEGKMYSLQNVMGQLRSVFGEGTMAPEEFAASLGKLESSLENGEITQESYEASLGRLTVAMYGAEGAQKAEYASLIAGKYAMSGLLAIVNASEADYEKLSGAIYDCDGAAQTMALTMTDNLSGAMTLMGSAAESVGIALYEKVSEPLKNTANVISGEVLPSIKSLITGEGDLQGLGSAIGTLFQTIPEEFAKAFPALDVGVMELVENLGNSLQENLPALMETGLTFLGDMAASLRENAGVLVDAGISLVLSLAQGLADSLPTLIEKVPDIVSDIAGAINDNAPKLLAAAAQLLATLGAGLIKAIPTLVKNIPSIINAIVNVLAAFNWVNLGSSIIKGLANGIKSAVGNVTVVAKTIVQNIRTVMSDLPGYMKAIGADLVKGLWNGIGNLAGWIKDQIKGFGKNIVVSIKSVFGIKSPSRVMRDEVGNQLALGIGEGFTESFGGVSREISQSMAGLSSNMMAAANLRQIQQDIDSAAAGAADYAAASAAAPVVMPAAQAPAFSAEELAAAVREALAGVKVSMDGREVGRLTAIQQNNMGRALGTA